MVGEDRVRKMGKFAITPLGAIMILITVSVVVSSIGLIITNFAALNVTQILDAFIEAERKDSLVLEELNHTTTTAREISADTNQIVSSGNRTNVILTEVRALADEIRIAVNQSEVQRQNQTRTFLPALQESFRQTDLIQSLVQNLTEILSEQRFTDKEVRDNQVQIAYDLDRIRNVTVTLGNYVGFLRANFNETMLEETYKEYANTAEMNNNIKKLLNITGF
jgi:hypothetical protein